MNRPTNKSIDRSKIILSRGFIPSNKTRQIQQAVRSFPHSTYIKNLENKERCLPPPQMPTLGKKDQREVIRTNSSGIFDKA